ncbi:hypothetical protein E2562_020180 [Oryza meyeriana var. granulata]|uniref:Uncharacterized protein n=1 Tax=Oryza meyeriana var. granulata TaxID=110450 RepID=A0A6G1BM74_9ORYZ|nr:hypothetical protein E2562_020180 [Oryza meyeriana var. granulata]
MIWRIARGLDDPREEARRFARMDEREQEEIRDLRSTFAAMEKACGFSRKLAPGRRVSFRLEGASSCAAPRRRRRRSPATSGVGVGESSSSSVAGGSEEQLCSAFGSSARV